MSPLLFLAIAIVVPLLGMLVLGVCARIKNQKVTDDETVPFRRRLESIAPPGSPDISAGDSLDSSAGSSASISSSGIPGLVQAMRRRKSGPTPAGAGDEFAPAPNATPALAHAAGSAAGRAAGSATAAVSAGANEAAAGPAGSPSGRHGKRRRGRRRSRRAVQPQSSASNAAPEPQAPTSVRLVEREYSVPLLLPLNAELDELRQPAQPRPLEAPMSGPIADNRPSDAGRSPDRPLATMRPSDAGWSPGLLPDPTRTTAGQSTPAGPQPAANPSAANPSAANPSAANPPAANPSAANPSAANPSVTHSSAANPSAANPSAAYSSAADPSAAGPSAGNPSAAHSSAASPSAANPSGAGQPKPLREPSTMRHPSDKRRSRRAIPRPPEAARHHDRVISPSQRRRPGS